MRQHLYLGSELPKPEILKLIGVSSTMATYFNASVGVHKSDVGVPSRLGSIPAGLPVPTIPYPTARGFVGKVLFLTRIHRGTALLGLIQHRVGS